jgi:hypothetical protein
MAIPFGPLRTMWPHSENTTPRTPTHSGLRPLDLLVLGHPCSSSQALEDLGRFVYGKT